NVENEPNLARGRNPATAPYLHAHPIRGETADGLHNCRDEKNVPAALTRGTCRYLIIYWEPYRSVFVQEIENIYELFFTTKFGAALYEDPEGAATPIRPRSVQNEAKHRPCAYWSNAAAGYSEEERDRAPAMRDSGRRKEQAKTDAECETNRTIPLPRYSQNSIVDSDIEK
ncbi:hypothetical protein GWI33_014663, partial [Rhynchophorus ferrugineus]